MQTFLPYPDLAQSAASLDWRRLGKQRVETMQIVKALTLPGYGWQNHPAVRMWRGHVDALVCYQRAVCFEWTVVRGFKDTCLDKTIDFAGTIGGDGCLFPGDPWAPEWFGDEAVHASHRSNLLRKAEGGEFEEFYHAHGWTEPTDLPYIWPV